MVKELNLPYEAWDENRLGQTSFSDNSYPNVFSNVIQAVWKYW